MNGEVHIVGAGLAGLAAAVDLAASGHRVTLYEAGPQAGGRCRSFFDAELGVRIDNGNHLLLSGNQAAAAYIARIGALDTFDAPAEAAFPFADLASGERWTLRPARGRIPWWICNRTRRVPGTRAGDYRSALRLCRAADNDTVAQAAGTQAVLYRRLWQPLAVAALNTSAEEASATLFWRIVEETLGRGAAACRPLLPLEGLSESLIDPALAFLSRRDGAVRLGARLRSMRWRDDHVGELEFDDGVVAVGADDNIVLAVPAAIAARLIPGLIVPDDFAPIVNAHFRIAAPATMPPFIGLIGGVAEWLFRKREVISVTVSAADRIVDRPAEELREMLWRDVSTALSLSARPAPRARIVKERRATFRATPAQLARRPQAETAWRNLHLAGDYVDTGLPATIEGAIRSGFAAAARVRQRHDPVPAQKSSPVAAIPAPTSIQDCQRALP